MKNKLTYLLILVMILVPLTYGCQGTIATPYSYEASIISDISFVVIDQQGNSTTVGSLAAEEFPEFLLLLSKLEAYEYWNDPIERTEGNNILITFTNGDYHLINSDSTVHYSDNNADFQWHYYNDADFETFWHRYVDLMP